MLTGQEAALQTALGAQSVAEATAAAIACLEVSACGMTLVTAVLTMRSPTRLCAGLCMHQCRDGLESERERPRRVRCGAYDRGWRLWRRGRSARLLLMSSCTRSHSQRADACSHSLQACATPSRPRKLWPSKAGCPDRVVSSRHCRSTCCNGFLQNAVSSRPAATMDFARMQSAQDSQLRVLQVPSGATSSGVGSAAGRASSSV